MEITIRPATEHDFAEIADLFMEFATFEKLPEKMVNTVDRMMAEKAYFNCFVAEASDKKIVGYATYFFAYYTWIGKSLYMDDLYVKPEFRAQGIGSKLIHTVTDFAKSTNCHKMRWQVSGWNTPAIGFYKKIGAIVDSTEQNCDLVLD